MTIYLYAQQLYRGVPIPNRSPYFVNDINIALHTTACTVATIYHHHNHRRADTLNAYVCVIVYYKHSPILLMLREPRGVDFSLGLTLYRRNRFLGRPVLGLSMRKKLINYYADGLKKIRYQGNAVSI